jgi:PAS domain S-box-containing protein
MRRQQQQGLMLHKLVNHDRRFVDRVRLWIAGSGIAVVVGIVFFLAAQLGLALLTTAERVAVFWPASGIAAGALIALGPRARAPVAVGVILASVAANMMGDRGFWSSLAFGLCNATEACLVAWVIERWFGPAFNLDSLRHVLGFFAAAVIGTASAAAGASLAMNLFGPSTAAFLDIWKVWFPSGALGVVTVAPLLIGIAAATRDVPPWREILEGTFAIVVVAATVGAALALLTGSWSLVGPATFLLPLLLWLGSRCRPVFTAAAAFTIAVTIVWTTIHEFGHFGDAGQPTTNRVLAAQIVMLGTTLTALALAALFAERRRDRANILASEARLRSVLRAANVIAWEVDLVRNAVHTVGPVENFLDKPWRMSTGGLAAFAAIILPEDRDRVLAEFSKALRTSTDYRLEFRGRSSTGGARWITAEGAIQRDDAGRPVSMLGITRDITARKKAERRLQENERKLRELLGALPAAIYVTDAAGHIIYCNQSAVDLWGVVPVLGKDKWDDLARFCHSDGTPMPLADCPTEIALKQGRIVRGQEAIIERKDGSRVPIVPYPTPLYNKKGAIAGVVNMTVDISERKKAELALAERNAQFSLAAKAALVGSHAYDLGADSMRVDEGYAALHGLPEGTAETTRSEWRRRAHPEDLHRVEAARAQAVLERQGEHSSEYRIIRSNGEVRWIESRSFMSYRGDGHPQRVVGVNIDITERKRAEEQLRFLIAELDHRVKNALATVSAVISGAQDTSGDAGDFVASLRGRIGSMAATHQLLSHHLWNGVPLSELVQRELAPYATGTNTAIDGPEVTLSAKAGQAVSMVLHELATNAAKHGALSVHDGRVSVCWLRRMTGNSDSPVCIEWQESGGPAVRSPDASGYGVEVIRDLIPYELGGAVDLTFASDGLRCRLEIPSEWLSDGTRLSVVLNGAGQPLHTAS